MHCRFFVFDATDWNDEVRPAYNQARATEGDFWIYTHPAAKKMLKWLSHLDR
jgi:hypothetical protein